jgi:hypothetical protein
MSSGTQRIRGLLTPKQKKYVESNRKEMESSKRRQWDYRIRESAKKGLEDLAFLAMNLTEDQQQDIFTVEGVVPLIGAMLSFQVSKQAGPFQGMWEQRRRFYLAAQLRALATRIVEEFNKVFLKDGEFAVTPSIIQWHEDSVIFSIGKEPFGAGTVPIALYKPGEPIKYARAAREIGSGEEVSKEGLEFVAWEELGKTEPEPIRILKYKRAPVTAPQGFVGEKAQVVWCKKNAERVLLGTCDSCEHGTIEECSYRESLAS